MNDIVSIHLYMLLQQLAQAMDPITKIKILRELAVYVYEGEKLKNLVYDLTDAEIELEAIIPRLYEDIEEIRYGNKDYIDDDIAEAYKITMTRLAELEEYIISELVSLTSPPETIEGSGETK